MRAANQTPATRNSEFGPERAWSLVDGMGALDGERAKQSPRRMALVQPEEGMRLVLNLLRIAAGRSQMQRSIASNGTFKSLRNNFAAAIWTCD